MGKKDLDSHRGKERERERDRQTEIRNAEKEERETWEAKNRDTVR